MRLVLADFTFGQALLTVLEIFLFIAWFWILITIVGDLFRDHTISGWAKRPQAARRALRGRVRAGEANLLA